MKGIKIMMIITGIAALILIFLAVNAMIQTFKVQKERPLKRDFEERQTQQVDTQSRRSRRR